MRDKPIWEQTRSSFTQHYYQPLGNNRTHFGSIYTEVSCLVWEGQRFPGAAAIMETPSSLLFQILQRSTVAPAHQPRPDGGIASMAVGQLQADEDPVVGFHQTFLLKSINGARVCTHDMVRQACPAHFG
ncbi:nuclear transport factor 2-like [Artibeus jamaicensis]|uniref:nuclear transport factor 2-like n=1 Tax=Artibeus jamaicensis TaxID=9417 RepID=UPI00235B0ACA|nr:nuclear transport factor 2-like [Artibeus jamaicensis]